jgi:hypothetical protein
MIKNLFRRRLGDRYDGWRVNDIDTVYTVVPYLLRTRLDSQCLFEENVDLDNLERFVKEHKEDIPGISIMTVVIAAMVRTLSQRPYANRFIVYNKLYAHNDIRISIMVKRTMGDRGEETPIMPVFSPFDTLREVAGKISTEIDKNRLTSEKNASDNTAGALGKLPPFLLRIIIGLIRWSDNLGILPKGIHTASPYHCSAFVTNMGSIGIAPIYHHLYEFGTCSFFSAMGRKIKTLAAGDDGGGVSTKRSIGFKYVIDERICDGHYWAVSIRYLRKLLNNPSVLLVPPEKVVIDDGIRRKLWHDPNAPKQ